MPVKEWFRRLQPVQLYLVLVFTIAFFLVEMVASYVTHALTLLMNAYHMLCNIVALVGCIATIKYENENDRSNESPSNSLKVSTNSLDENSLNHQTVLPARKAKQSRSEKRMKNTFGWARIDVVTMLICCVLLASFCFSLIVEALQTLIHINHLDEMHHPLPVMSIGASGILLNAFCYFLIGGYTFNQGIFLHFTHNGGVILKRSTSHSSRGDENEQTRRSPIILQKSQGIREMCRDVLGCVLVMMASCLVYFTDSHIAKYIDPIFAIVSAASLFVLSYPYMRESGMILLQTIPDHININSLQKDLLAAFPDIVNVHDLHVWQLNGAKVVSTVHIIYADPSVCARITDQITAFFAEIGITHVTIQPEFSQVNPHYELDDCLIRCQSKQCITSRCCSRDGLESEGHQSLQHRHIVNRKADSKEIVPAPPEVNLKRFTVSLSEVNEVESLGERLYSCTCRDAVIDTMVGAVLGAVGALVVDEGNLRTVDVDVVKCSSSSEELTIEECTADDLDGSMHGDYASDGY